MTRALRLLPLASALALAAAPPATADRLFVSSFQTGEVRRFDLPSSAGRVVASGLFAPEDGACSPSGLVYFAESIDGRITRWDQDGGHETNVVPAAGPVDGPEGLSFSPAGDLFFNTREIFSTAAGAWRIPGGDPAGAAVRQVPPFTSFGEGSDVVLAGPHAGALLLVARGETRVLLSEPPGAAPQVLVPASAFPPAATLYGVATNGCGEIFVALRDLSPPFSGVYRFAPDGAFLDVYASGLVDANFLDFDSAGNLYVSDQQGNAVYRVAPDRTRTLFAAFPGPIGVAVCRDRAVPDCPSAPLRCGAGGPELRECAGPVTCLALSGSASEAGASFSWTTDCPGGSFAGTETQASPTLCLAAAGCLTRCTATLTVRQGSRSAACAADVTVVDTSAPSLQGVPPDATVECDRVPPPLPVTADDDCEGALPVSFAETRTPGDCPGRYTLARTWTAGDACGNSVTSSQTLAVVDTAPPRVEPGGDVLACLWPPNHGYVCLGADALDPVVRDACSAPVAWRVAACASDQPDDAREGDPRSPWNGDGHTTDDCVVLPGGAGVCARAERCATGPGAQEGRRYGVAVVATDACGNASAPVAIGNVHVPHDQAPRERPCLDPTVVGCRPGQAIPCAGRAARGPAVGERSRGPATTRGGADGE